MFLKAQDGQAVSEFLVTMAVLVPLLLMAASFANLMNLSTETVEAGRFAAWERTFYKADGVGNLTSLEVQEQVQNNVRDIYLAKNYTDFGPGKALNTSALPSIVDRVVNGGQPVSLSTPPAVDIADTELVSKDTRLAQGLQFGSPKAMQSPQISIAMNSDYSLLKSVSFNNYREATYQDPAGLPADDAAGRDQFHLAGHSALIADGWMPSTNQELKNVTSAVTFDGRALGTYEAVNQGLNFLRFQEAGLALGADGLSTVAESAPDILPSDL